ncbi:hypothetical protein ACPDHL_14665 [Myroides sp. C15-4]|uniref:hypothetical protein n=1 Tax=Myroides sp. C15-4 TaxID=3400532 RepID=UPI003D2F5F93
MSSNEIFELDQASICELVGKRFRVSYKEERNGIVEAVSHDKKLIALDYSDKQEVNHYIFSDGVQHIKIPSAHLVTMTQV